MLNNGKQVSKRIVNMTALTVGASEAQRRA
jgi:hypothetical protein